jgi:formylglycine-generating enzyme
MARIAECFSVAKAMLLLQALPMTRLFTSIVALFFAAFTLIIQPSAQADTFGTSGNEFTIDFVNIGNTDNAADTTSYGAVPYEYRASTHEISQDAITKATASGMADVRAGAWTGNQPAADISWYEAAAFVNFLNTNSAKTAAYDLSWNGTDWSMSLWSSEQAWTAGGTNLYRNKNAYYFLPSENEWYKAAYYNAAGSNHFLYPTASSSVPTAVASGTTAGSAVYNGVASVPAIVDSAGGLSPYGTMGQGGNVFEWTESAFDGTNSSASEVRAYRSGSWYNTEDFLRSSSRGNFDPRAENGHFGFRVASVPEPSTYALLLMTAAGALWFTRKRRPIKVSALIPVVAVLLAAFALISNLQAQPLVSIETVPIGDAGNAADNTGYGSVAYEFNIGEYEVTIGQYTSFLNAVAATDTYSLYNPSMATDLSIAGITQNGGSGGFSYSAIGSGNRPITFVSWFDGARFANWMNNGATNGASTETGAYTLNGASSGVAFTKNSDATWWIPSEDEWVKAAYYKSGGTNADYWLYPTQSGTAPAAQANPPGAPNSANFNGVRSDSDLLTEVGAYSTSPSAYGTFDQAGNVWEWNDAVSGSERGSRGGSYFGDFAELQSGFRGSDPPTGEYRNVGFRLATVPEPSTYALLAMSAAGALWMTRKRR